VYVRQIDDQVLTLQVSGKLWMRSLVMRDVETHTEWAHLLGRGMAGPLKDRKLKPLITDMVTWSVWKSMHPDTTVLNMPRTSKHYDSDFYSNADRFVFGFDVNGETRSVLMSRLQTTPVINCVVAEKPLLVTFNKQGAVCHLFDRVVDDQVLQFSSRNETTMTDDMTGTVWTILDGEAVEGPLKGTLLKQRVGIMSFRRAWQSFHPDSKLLGTLETGQTRTKQR
jgi:Protein of unknown function (DUF3179)